MTVTSESRAQHVDGGVGWLVVFGSAVVVFTTAPFMTVFSLLYEEKLNAFNAGAKTWTFCIYLMTWSFSGLMACPFIELRGHRWTALVGVLLMTTGALLSAFAKSSWDMFIAIGLVLGCGQGFATNTAFIIVTTFFKAKIGLAMGVVFLVMALGGIALPLAMAQLLNHFSNQICVVIYSCFIAIGFLGAAFFMASPGATADDDSKNGSQFRRNAFANFFALITWSLLKDPFFWVTIIGISLALNMAFNFYVLLPILVTALGLNKAVVAKLFAVESAISLVSRFFFAWLGDWSRLKHLVKRPRKLIFALSALALSIVMIALPWCQSFGSLVVATCFVGTFNGSLFSNSILVFSESCPDDIPSAIGLSSMLRALVALMLGPLLDALGETEEGYKSCFWVLAGLTIGSMCLWPLEEIFVRPKGLTKKKNEPRV